MRTRKFVRAISILLVLAATTWVPVPVSAAKTELQNSSAVTAVWANNGGDKVTRDELRASSNSQSVINTVWDGTKVILFGAKNEVVAFNLIMEASSTAASNITLSFNNLTGPGGSSITSSTASGDGVFDWTNRNIELFYVRYLEIKGLSILSYGGGSFYDERHIPKRFQRPWTGEGEGSGTWQDRPDHNKFYPDIAVPLELVSSFTIASGQNQSIWVDIYIPENVTAGLYTGTVTISENGTEAYQIPVELTVRDFTLPDMPNAKTMLYLGYADINMRYLGEESPSGTDNENASKLIRDRHFLLAHRHRISLIDENPGVTEWESDNPRPEWIPRLDGSLFTATQGYDGPGVNTGNNIFSIGTYGSWDWQNEGESGMYLHTDAWVNWFKTNSPETEYFLYLIDESANYKTIEKWAQWINNNSGPGSQLMSMATIDLLEAAANTPALDIATSWFEVGINKDWQSAADSYISASDKRFYLYNAHRPGSGSFATEDDGVALRELAWGHYKKEIERWFYWESTYYNNYQGEQGETNVFQNAHTFGNYDELDNVIGETGWNYCNGDGVLFYPGTDLVYPKESYGVKGPFVSLRLKHWRRGIQDVDYLTMAAVIDSTGVQHIVDKIVPKVLWEYGVDDSQDPTWVLTDISWSVDPDDWEKARADLANVIESNTPLTTTTAINGSTTSTTVGSTTTTTTACPAEEIYGEYSEQTEILRYIRDNVLNETPEGQEIIKLYYQWGPVIVKAMEADEAFKEDVKKMVDGVLELITEEAE